MAGRDSASLLVGLFFLFHTWGAWASVEVNMEDRVEVFRGDTAQINCMFTSSEGIGGVMIHWFYLTQTGQRQSIYYQDTTMKVVERGTPFTDRVSVNGTGATGELVLTIRDVKMQDEVEFICQIKSLTEGIGEGRTQLRVFETPEFPSIEGVHTGISVRNDIPSKIGICEVKNGFPRPNITWYRDSMPLQYIDGGVNVLSLITIESTGLFSVKSELSLRVVEEDKDALFYCEVTYFVPGGTRMTESKRINITVHYPTTNISVWVESPKGKIKEGDTVELHCRGNGYPQPLFTFKHGDLEMTPDSNVLVLKDVTRLQNGLYHCTTMDLDTYEDITGDTTVVVNYLDPAVMIPGEIVISQGEHMSATCNALSSLDTHAVWFKNGEEVAKGHTLMLKDAVFETAGTYVCVVTVPEIEGMETSGTLRVLVQGPPEISEPTLKTIEESVEKTVNLTCHARGFPTPSITWSSSDGQVLKMVSHKTTEDGVLSVASVKVTSDISAAFCNASNDYGTDTVAFSIKAIIHTTTSATTTTTTTTVKAATALPPKKIKKEGSGVIIAVIIICILLLAILGSVLYFLYKKGKICGRSGKQDLTKEKSNKDNIVVEMKSDNTEEAVLLGVNGDKKPPSDQ